MIMAKNNAKVMRPVHFTEAMKMISAAFQHRERIDIKVWVSDGRIDHLQGWLVQGEYWRKGYVRFRNPSNGQIRLYPEIFIHEVDGHRIYL